MSRASLPLPLVLLFVFHAVAQSQEPPAVFLDYKELGARGLFETVEIRILASGETTVKSKKYNSEAAEYQTTLSTQELETFRITTHAVGYFTATFEQGVPRMHAADIELLIRDGKHSKTHKGTWPDECEPLSILLYRLTAQARALLALKADEDIYTIVGAVKHSHAGAKVLQPAKLREPLMEYIRTHQDRQRVNWALQALAEVTSPDEFAGFVAIESRKRKAEDSLISMDSKGWIPDTHFLALCPVYLAYIREHVYQYEKLTQPQRETFEKAEYGLRDARYAPAAPLLIEVFRKLPDPKSNYLYVVLASLGQAGLQRIAPVMEEGNDAHRLAAIDVVEIMAQYHPKSGASNPVPEHEFASMRVIFDKYVLPALRRMAEKDSSKTIREEALKTIGVIEVELAK